MDRVVMNLDFKNLYIKIKFSKENDICLGQTNVPYSSQKKKCYG